MSASKDLTAFSQIQSIQNNENPKSEAVIAFDDVSQAKLMQAKYSEAGLDPVMALNPDDLAEFGGIENFNGQFRV